MVVLNMSSDATGKIFLSAASGSSAAAAAVAVGSSTLMRFAAALWIASAVLKLKDAGIDADSIKDNAVNIIIATVMGVIAFAE